jgi:hypothetical protein
MMTNKTISTLPGTTPSSISADGSKTSCWLMTRDTGIF